MTDEQNPIDKMVELIEMIAPSLGNIANSAETLVDRFRKHGISDESRLLAEMLAYMTPALELFQSACTEHVPRIRAALDEMQRMHEGN